MSLTVLVTVTVPQLQALLDAARHHRTVLQGRDREPGADPRAAGRELATLERVIDRLAASLPADQAAPR